MANLYLYLYKYKYLCIYECTEAFLVDKGEQKFTENKIFNKYSHY